MGALIELDLCYIPVYVVQVYTSTRTINIGYAEYLHVLVNITMEQLDLPLP